jgi:hypothetical protein
MEVGKTSGHFRKAAEPSGPRFAAIFARAVRKSCAKRRWGSGHHPVADLAGGGDIAEGRLLPLLDQWTATVGAQEGMISGVFPANRRGSPKVVSFLDHLAAHFGSPPYWERQIAPATTGAPADQPEP